MPRLSESVPLVPGQWPPFADAISDEFLGQDDFSLATPNPDGATHGKRAPVSLPVLRAMCCHLGDPHPS